MKSRRKNKSSQNSIVEGEYYRLLASAKVGLRQVSRLVRLLAFIRRGPFNPSGCHQDARPAILADHTWAQ